MASADRPSPTVEQQPAAPTRLVLSTDAVPERDRLPFFVEEMSRILRTDMTPLADGPPRFFMDFTEAGPTSFALLQGTPSRHLRTRQHIGDSNEDFTFVLFNAGWQSTNHNNRMETILQGDGFLFNNAIGTECHIPESHTEVIALRMDSEALGAVVKNPEEKAGMRFPIDLPGMALLKGYLQAFYATSDTLTPALLHSFGLHVIDLVAAILGATRDGAAHAEAGGIKAARLREVLTAIATRATDPSFSVDALASRLAISSRYIQRLLEETGTSFSEHLLEQRLRRAWRLLTDPGSRDLKVATIAFDCGFNDLGTFNRVFRRRFGETPTAVRGAALAPAPASGATGEPTLAEHLARQGGLQ